MQRRMVDPEFHFPAGYAELSPAAAQDEPPTNLSSEDVLPQEFHLPRSSLPTAQEETPTERVPSSPPSADRKYSRFRRLLAPVACTAAVFMLALAANNSDPLTDPLSGMVKPPPNGAAPASVSSSPATSSPGSSSPAPASSSPAAASPGTSSPSAASSAPGGSSTVSTPAESAASSAAPVTYTVVETKGTIPEGVSGTVTQASVTEEHAVFQVTGLSESFTPEDFTTVDDAVKWFTDRGGIVSEKKNQQALSSTKTINSPDFLAIGDPDDFENMYIVSGWQVIVHTTEVYYTYEVRF